MTLFKNKFLPLLLALLMVLTMLPMTALAAELPDETTTVCTDEHCTHEHEPADVYAVQPDTDTTGLLSETPETSAPPVSDEPPIEETPAPEEPEPPAETDQYSGQIGNSDVAWALDPTSGRLIITGTGGCDTFTSPEDQPWAALRGEIREVWFNSMDTLTIESLAYWFDGCTALEMAEVPYTTPIIGTRAFADCPELHHVLLYYSTGVYTIEAGAFAADSLTALEIDYIAALEEPAAVLHTYDWSADNRAAYFADVYSMIDLAVGSCSLCKKTCSFTLGYDQWTDDVHCVRHWCSNCGLDQVGGILSEYHTFSNGVCTKCGYDNGTGGGGSVCYHYSTYKSWSGCNWTEYCSNCGAYINSGTSHGSTYTSWSGCNWYEYCRDCGQLMDSGTSHSAYVYGSWEYYNSSRHRRSYSCSSCGQGSYEYGYHSTGTKYSQYSSTQHSYGSYCSTCGSYIGSMSYASHNFSYGSWQNYNGSQHRRLKTCSTCGYSEYEYFSHSLSYGSWTNYSASQHRRSVSCSCGYSSYEYASHSLTGGAWASVSDTQHRRTLSCSCGYSTTETANHSLTYGAWASISNAQHQRTGTCACGYSTTETGAHTDANDDGYCDDCEYLMTRFSVTVPASLSLTVSEHGAVYAANNAAIVNNSTGAVEITGVTVSTANGWTLVPYSSNMAAAKVDSKRIGFSLNGAQSAASGTTESLSLPGAWSIAKGTSLPLTYDAVVSAISQPVREQVLTVMFVLDWAA